MPRKALLIGVGQYEHYPSLTTAVDGDLNRVEAALRNAGVREVKRLGGSGEKVSVTMLRSAIARFIEKAANGADLLIYFTGHGQSMNGVTYLVPSEAVTDLVDKKSYLVEASFDAEVTVSRARSVSFVVDACRTPLDGEPAAGNGQQPARPRTTIVYACAPGEQAAALPGPEGISLFTEAFAELVVAAGQGVPLNELRARLQERTEGKGRKVGLARVPQIDVWPGTELETAPFAFFQTGRSTPPGQRWSALLSPRAAGLGFGTPSSLARFTEVCGCLDEIEDAAPSVDDALLRVLPDQTLPERIANAMVLVLSRGCADDGGKPLIAEADRLLVLAVAAALEAAVRSVELTAAKRTAQRWRDAAGEREAGEEIALTRLAVIAPQFARVYPELPPARQRLLEAWCDRVLSLREAIGKPQTLRGHLARLLPSVYGAAPTTSVDDLSRYLTGHLHEEFIGRESDTFGGGETRRGPQEVLAPTSGGDTAVMLDGRRAAALVRLIWLLSADTRLLAPELGLTLSQDGTSPAEALHPLGELSWVPEGAQVIDLKLSASYAPLDRALRQLAEEITAFLLTTSQPVMPLHGLDLPRAATTTRLLPARRDGKPVFHLPHLRFEASAVETTELLMGTNLYGDAHVAIRELYQNAVDACLYRDWRIKNIGNAAQGWRPSYEPEIVFSDGRDERGAWIECWDNGVGMSSYELRESFAKIGKRFRDLPEFLEEAKEWGDREDIAFRPISQFGIGVLSYFMLAKQVELRTTRSDDRHSRFSEPLLVSISDATGIFRFEEPRGLPAAGTAVRLYLREEFADLDLAAALSRVIAAPLVRTRLIADASGGDGRQWEPGRLYTATGEEMRAFGVRQLGVYFHEGEGRVLVNGIPLNALGGPAGPPTELRGVTISLDARSRPRLSVDRSRLLSVDLGEVRKLLGAAAGDVPAWPDASVSWLLALFATDPETGSAAYRSLTSANRDLILEKLDVASPHQPFGTEPAGTRPSASALPVSAGVSALDNQIGPRPSAKELREGELRGWDDDQFSWRRTFRLARERRRILWSKDGGLAGPGFPAFDDRLIRLLSFPRDGLLSHAARTETSAPDRLTPRLFTNYPVVAYDTNDPLPERWREIAGIAAQAKTTIGSAVAFAWAVRFLNSRAKVTTPRLIAAIDRAGRAGRPTVPADTSLSELRLFSSARLSPAQQIAAVLLLADGLPDHADFVAAMFPEAESREFAAAYRELRPVEQQQLRSLLRPIDTRNYIEQLPTGLKSFMARFPNVFATYLPHLKSSWDGSDSKQTTGTVDKSLSQPARWALSWDFDGAAPYYTNDAPIPAIRVALAAAIADGPITPEDIRAELAQAGYQPASPGNWEAIRIAASDPSLFGFGGATDVSIQADGRVALTDDLRSLTGMAWLLGPAKVAQFAKLLHEAGIDADSTRRIALLDTLRNADLADLSEALEGEFPLTMDAASLVRLADRRSVSLGESLMTLARYRPLSDPHWRLPDRLPPELADRRPSEAEVAFVQLASRTGGPHDWREIAVQDSALSGRPLADLDGGILPLLSACGEPTEDLDGLRAAWPGPITFDDLLILGSLQTWPNLGSAEIDALCRPWCRWPDDLADRVGRWLSPTANGAQTPAQAWTKGQS